MKTIKTKYYYSILCDALHRNINDNFENISFKICDGDEIQIKVILKKRTGVENEYIKDMLAEFEAMQDKGCIKSWEIVVGKKELPLENVIYQIADGQ